MAVKGLIFMANHKFSDILRIVGIVAMVAVILFTILTAVFLK